MRRPYLSGGDHLFGEGREVYDTLSDFRVAGEVGIEGHMDGARSRLARARSSPLLCGVNDFEVLLVDLCHEHLARLERAHEISVMGCKVGQRIL